MRKLINLLNEYRTEKGERNLNVFEVSQTLDSLNYLRLFIKWLVENDKIDYQKDWLKDNDTCYIFVKKNQNKSDFEIRVDALLMILSIQDNSIEFLISILN